MTTTMAPTPALTDVRCRGRLRDGRPCNRLYFKATARDFREMFRANGNQPFQFECPKCGRLEWFGPVE